MTVRAPGVLRAASVPDRTITYLLLPYGQPGRTSIGLVTASAGSVDVPSTQDVVLNLEHDPLRPVGRLLSHQDTPDGLVATFRIAATQAGTDLLVEADEGLRTGVSVELDQVRVKDGTLLPGAVLIGAGAVTRPAFDDARTLLVASDTPDDDDPAHDHRHDDVTAPVPSDTTPDDDDTAPVPSDDESREDTTVDDTTLTAAAPVGAHPVTTQDRTPDLAAVNRMLASAARDGLPQLLAALTDVTHTANAHVQAPQFIGEAWSGSPYTRQLVPLVASGPLTSYEVTGWRWKVAPEGGDYTGDKTAVPSNAALTEAVKFTAERWAGAHDIDRKFRDFGDEAFWSSYWAAMAGSYGRWSDANVAAGIKTAATAVTGGDAGNVVDLIVRAALAVIPVGTPTYCLLGATAYSALAQRDPYAFLSGSVSIPGGDGTVGGLAFRTHTSLAAGDVIVGTRNAATWYELGGTPIRVESVDLVKGGIDVGAFGYGVLGVHDAAGIAKATFTPAAP
jgi:hypothetical protein